MINNVIFGTQELNQIKFISTQTSFLLRIKNNFFLPFYYFEAKLGWKDGSLFRVCEFFYKESSITREKHIIQVLLYSKLCCANYSGWFTT